MEYIAWCSEHWASRNYDFLDFQLVNQVFFHIVRGEQKMIQSPYKDAKKHHRSHWRWCKAHRLFQLVLGVTVTSLSIATQYKYLESPSTSWQHKRVRFGSSHLHKIKGRPIPASISVRHLLYISMQLYLTSWWRSSSLRDEQQATPVPLRLRSPTSDPSFKTIFQKWRTIYSGALPRLRTCSTRAGKFLQKTGLATALLPNPWSTITKRKRPPGRQTIPHPYSTCRRYWISALWKNRMPRSFLCASIAHHWPFSTSEPQGLCMPRRLPALSSTTPNCSRTLHEKHGSSTWRGGCPEQPLHANLYADVDSWILVCCFMH